MPHVFDGVQLDELTTDPTSPVNGQIWYNSTDDRFKMRIDGITQSATHLSEFQDHKARHIRGGADELDGDQLDIDYAPTNYTPSTAPAQVSDNEHLTAHLAGIDTKLARANSLLSHKAGRVLNATFTGNPKTASVSFATAFADADYAVTVTAVSSGKGYVPFVQNQTASGFDINVGSNNIADLIQVNWVAVKDGEST